MVTIVDDDYRDLVRQAAEYRGLQGPLPSLVERLAEAVDELAPRYVTADDVEHLPEGTVLLGPLDDVIVVRRRAFGATERTQRLIGENRVRVLHKPDRPAGPRWR